MSGGAEAAKERALRLLDADAPATEPVPGGDTLAVAWALKELCFDSWASQPARAARAAELLGQLSSAGLASRQALELQGLAQWCAGLACVTRGQMTEAVAAFDQAAQALREAQLPDPAAQTQVPKIMALAMLGQHEQAAACAEQARRELLALGNLHAASRVCLNLGNLLMQRDDYGGAASRYREAAVLFARLGDPLHSVLSDIGLAVALTSQGDVDEGLRIYARARMRAGNERLLQPLAMVDESVALVELSRGHYREALAGFESARRGFEALGLPHALAIAEKQLADAYLELRLLPEALALFDTAMAQFAQLQLPEEQARALAQRGRTLALLGRTTAAASSFAEASALFASHQHAVGLSGVQLALAELALVQGDVQAALREASQASAGFARAGQADGLARAEVIRAQALWLAGQHAQALAIFTTTLETARAQQQLPVQVRCLTGQGVAALAQGQRTVAEQAFEAAIELLEDQRHALPGDDLRTAFITDQLRPYQERLRMALDEGDASQVLAQLERSRARSLSDRFDEGAAVPDEAGETDGDPELRERLNWLYRRVQRLQEDAEPSAALNDELVRTERELLERARRRRLAAPARAVAASDGFIARELQCALDPGDALVEYGVLDDELFAVVVTQSRVVVQRGMALWGQACQAAQSARFQIDTLRHGVAPVAQHLAAIHARTQARLRQLHALLWAPLQDALAGCSRVLLVPQGQLGAVPFAALADGSRPLGQACQVALVPSARAALRGLRRTPVAPRTALAIGDSERLPHAAREARGVAALFPHGLAFVGAEATLLNLRQHAAGADVLHLACHAQFRSDNPRFSALHLCDGALTVELAEGLALRQGTVVLSACESGLSEDGGGNEMVGLVRAFLVAGAARVVGTLWPVDDEVTANFMAHFYGALVAGHTPALALQAAQAATRRDRPEPYFWAPFTLYGGW